MGGNEKDQSLPRVEVLELFDNDLESNEQTSILLLLSVAVEVPSRLVELLVEGSKERELDVVGEGHVVLDGIQSSKNEVEEADLGGREGDERSASSLFQRTFTQPSRPSSSSTTSQREIKYRCKCSPLEPSLHPTP